MATDKAAATTVRSHAERSSESLDSATDTPSRHKQTKSVKGRRPRRRSRRWALTPRDQAIIAWVSECRFLTRQNIQDLLFSAGGRSLCQQRLTQLTRSRYLDTIPNRAINEPAVYWISPKARQGIAWLRQHHGEEPSARGRPSGQTLQHTLAINSCRVALHRACEAMGWSIETWLTEYELRSKVLESGFLPDAFFVISRPTSNGERRSGHFIETELSAKSHRALGRKCSRIGDYYRDESDTGYSATFGLRSLRVLFLMGSDYGINPERRLLKVADIASKLDVTLLRLASLDTFLAQPPSELLIRPFWRQPSNPENVALFAATAAQP